MRIRVYLSGMQYHPEPDALRLRAGGVVPRQRVGQADGQPGDQPALRHFRGSRTKTPSPLSSAAQSAQLIRALEKDRCSAWYTASRTTTRSRSVRAGLPKLSTSTIRIVRWTAG